MHTLEELNDMSLLQRFKVHDWRLEMFILLFIVLFIFLFKIGDIYNNSKVSAFLAGVRTVFEDNFALYGVGDGLMYVKDSSENYSSYASGNANIAKVNINFRLAPRQNIFLWAMESIMSMFMEAIVPPEDRVNIFITPSVEYEHFITAIVSKFGMDQSRKLNYYLSLTRATDSDLLPSSFVFMSEANEFQAKTFTEKLSSSLTDSAASFLKFVAFTDQPHEKPEALRDLIPHRRIVISSKIVTGKQQLAELSLIIEAVLDVVDQIASKQITFKVEAARKIIKTREAEIEKIKKAEEQIKQEALADEKAQLRKKERENLKNLSRDKQLNAEKKAQEKKQRKAQKKMRVRG
ncbi:DUF1682-domain-containing protein [Metschnikowia bicuspidata]|uniref:DUF1682-domain-containing protein n=1 Tax=Metschnikowia bicuspidata TaxID=27322 RepID=A0A4P9ZIP1_9ASCO|nr:DUF1682-domain-containing protein [Metschnikowia bicuspidata]